LRDFLVFCSAEKLWRQAMKSGREWRAWLFLLFLLFLMIIVTDCSLKLGVPQWSGSGFIRKEFLEYKSVAVLPFEGDDSGEVSNAFSLSFHEKFPQISIVARKRVLEVLRHEAFNPGRLDEESRLRIGNTLGVQALIAGNIYYPSITRWLLQITILDTETGKVMGRSLVEIDFMGAMGREEGARFAVEKLTTR
jgi:hypothetical protein